MALNLGYVEGTCNDGEIVVRVYYDATADPSGPQPLIDGPRGWCLDLTNLTGGRARLTVNNGTASVDLLMGTGDPVTTGPASGRSRTAANMAALGFTTRASLGSFSLECPAA